jgi:hypothetical protein
VCARERERGGGGGRERRQKEIERALSMRFSTARSQSVRAGREACRFAAKHVARGPKLRSQGRRRLALRAASTRLLALRAGGRARSAHQQLQKALSPPRRTLHLSLEKKGERK